MSNVDMVCGPQQYMTGEDDIDLLVDQEFLKEEMTGIDEHVDLRYCLTQLRKNNQDS